MEKGRYRYNTTCLDFNLETADEKICYDFFQKCGRKWKSFLLTILTLRFPDYFENENMAGELEKLVEEYAKDFEQKESDHPVFLGWHHLEYRTDYLADMLLNKYLKGGAKDFIVFILKESLPFMFNEEKKAEESKTSPEEIDDEEDLEFLHKISHQFDHMNIIKE